MIAYRSLTETDTEDWGRMRAALWPEEDPTELARELAEVLKDPLQAGFGAFDIQRLVGFAEVSERPWGEACRTRPVGWLEGIYVEPAARRARIGAALVAAAEDWARARGLKEFGSDALIDNQVSIAAHGRWGFAETQRTVSFRKELT